MSLLTDRQAIGAVVLVAGGLWYLSRKAGSVVNAVNPLNNDNIFIEGVESLAGEENVATFGDYLFGGIALVNPWADETSKNYARDVYGVSDATN